MRKVILLFITLLSFAGATMAQKSLPYSYGFEDYNLDTDGWTTYFGTSLSKNNNECKIVGDAKKTGSYGFRFSSFNTAGANAQYLISPELNASNGVDVSFAWKVSHGQYSESFKVGYSTTNTDVSSFTWDEGTTSNSTSWKNYENSFPAGTKYVAIYYYSNYCGRLYVDDFSFTAPLNGPALVVEDGTTAINNGYNYNFGLAIPGTTHYFRLSNPGTTNLSVSVSETGNFGATLTAPTIPAGSAGYVLLNITMPSTSGSSAITITPEAGSGIDPFVINVSGTIRDANKLYEQGFTALPEDWTTTGTWYYNETNGAYTSVWYLSSNARLITPKLNISEGETFFVEAKGYSTSNTSYQHLQMQYSADGTTWTNFGSEPTLDPSNWQTFSFTGVPAGQYYIAINASQADIRMFYGGELPQEPKMVVTQPESLDFGVITAATTKTFTIANTGHATLEGINVTSSNDVFTVTGAPTSLAAGESAEVTITMAATTTGQLFSDIIVSATGMTDVLFTVTGIVLPEGLMVVDFNDNQLPANWTNASWTFASGAATGKSSSAYLTTPKLIFKDGDLLVIKAKRADSDATDYITIQGSDDNGATWTAYNKKITGSDGLAYPDFGTLVLSDIPATVNKLRFVGYYVVVDEIAGLTYASVLSVKLGETAVSSPAAYNFGDCSTDASVTYNFTNEGAGTIEITNVAITGEGAAAYSTNWTTSTTVPFDLEITRTYVAGREGASDATVTVTTTEGDFVINVTGTDKAANAPELTLTPAEDADFGVVTAATSKTYTVTNAGTGLLTVNIYSNEEKFTVAPAQLTDIAAGESKTFDVTFTPVAETYGTFTAEIVVIPTYDDSAAIPFYASATVKDPNVWREDFSAGTVPTGWNADSNWTIEGGTANAKYAYGSTSYYLTTPVLTVSDASDELTFYYEATANYVSIKIQMSKDGSAFADYQTISGLNNGDAGTYTITGLEAGDYQFRFANDDYLLDNFEGFKLNLADHIISIAASTIPDSKSWDMTMKEGRSFEATVTVKEMRGVAEEVTAKFYMGNEVIGTATGSVAANGTETLTITATPTASATDGIEMHIEVEYAGGTVSTDPVTRYVAALTYYTLDENSSDEVWSGTYDFVTLKRTFAAGWNTVCLPFTISDVEGFFGTGAKAYTFNSYVNGELNFSMTSELTASYPYIIYVPTAITEDIELTDITIKSVDEEPFLYSKNGVYLRGTYAPIAAGQWTKSNTDDIIYGVTTDGHIMKAGSTASIKGFRAYFDVPTASEVKALSFDGEDATGISDLKDLKDSKDLIFNVAGQRIQKMQKGINIINGKKVLK